MAVSTRGLNLEVDQFTDLGYVVVPDLLSAQEAGELNRAFDELPLVTEHSDIIGWRAEAGERALASDERFLRLVTKPRLVDTIRALIGDDLQLIDYVAMEIGPHSGRHRAWHVDLPFFTDPACLSVIAAVYLDEMTDEMGPLLVIPESQRRGRQPSREEAEAELEGETKVSVPAGTAVLFNSQLWHTGTANESDRPRRALFPHFAHYWMKRMDDFYVTPLPENVTASSDPLLRQLFGLELAVTSIWGPDYTREREKIRI